VKRWCLASQRLSDSFLVRRIIGKSAHLIGAERHIATKVLVLGARQEPWCDRLVDVPNAICFAHAKELKDALENICGHCRCCGTS
jgi:hypothetical protein